MTVNQTWSKQVFSVSFVFVSFAKCLFYTFTNRGYFYKKGQKRVYVIAYDMDIQAINGASNQFYLGLSVCYAFSASEPIKFFTHLSSKL